MALAWGASSSTDASCKPCTRNGGGTTPAQGTPCREATHCYRHAVRGCKSRLWVHVATDTLAACPSRFGQDQYETACLDASGCTTT
jgi:hypothetical protein